MRNYRKALLLSIVLYLAARPVSAQTNDPKIAYVVDSIPIMEDPDPEDSLATGEISDMTIVRNKDSLQRLGYSRFDMVSFIFTRAYRARPDSLKAIPSTKQMVRKNGVLYFHEIPYSGRFIDYFLKGSIAGEGRLAEGRGDGLVIRYYPNGQKQLERNYRNGSTEGVDREFYPDGRLSQEGAWVAGKEEGVWRKYFPNGQVKMQSTYQRGELVDSAFSWYSTGRVSTRVAIRNGKVVADARQTRIDQLMAKSSQSDKDLDIAAAIKYAGKAIELDSNYAPAYFSLGTLELNDLKFDAAIADLDKALTIEPYMEFALANRAFARIRKYQFRGSRTLSKNKDVTVLASKDKVDIPAAEKAMICSDLSKAIYLGDKNEMILEAWRDYCQ